MIIRLYRTNQSIIQLGLPLIAVVFWSLHFFFPIAPAPSAIPQWFTFQPEWPMWVWQVLQMALVLLEAIVFNRIINDLELFDRISYVPSLIYVLVAFMLIPNGFFQWSSLSNYFILQTIHTLLQVYRQNSAKEEAFISGFLLGIAFLFSWYVVPLVVWALLAMNTLKTFYWREWLLFIIAFLFPWWTFEAIYFAMYGQWSIVVPQFEMEHWTINPLGADRSTMMFSIFLLVMVVLGLFSLLGRFSGSIIRVRRQRQVLLYFFIIMILISITVNAMYVGNGMQLLVIPFALSISFLLVHSAFQWLTDLLFYAAIGLFLLSRIAPLG